MQTLRKKTSPLKYKNETSRFLGDGVSFKAKLIGILEVSEARGDRMCQEALSDLKMAIRAAGEHKQRITINIAIDGLRLRDEKTGDSLYHHPVHKISFIAQDMTDSRAFGYIFGSPDTGHRFFGIKTDKAASQVVIAMRDLFQVVFALKKKEIELAKQHLEKTCYPSPLFLDSSSSSSKSVPHVSIKSTTETKTTTAGPTTADSKGSGTAVADLVDLELELNSLQQGLNQMERITPSDPFGAKDDPFGDSFISYPAKPILPPPPSSNRERSNRTSDSSSSNIFSPKTPHTAGTVDSATSSNKKDFSFSRDFDSSRDEPSSGDWFSAPGSIFEEPSPLSSLVSPPVIVEKSKDEKHEQAKQEILSQFDVFTELDPLELKNPPKKPLKELATTSNSTLPIVDPPPPSVFPTAYQQSLPTTTTNSSSFSQPVILPQSSNNTSSSQGVFNVDPFGEDPFVKEDPFADSDFSKQDPFETEFANFASNQNSLDQFKFQDALQTALSKSPLLEKPSSVQLLSTSPKLPVTTSTSNSFQQQQQKPIVNFTRERKITPQQHHHHHHHDNPSLDVSSEGECAPEPPPRPYASTTAAQMQQQQIVPPPPLPPKKQGSTDHIVIASKPPPRPSYHTVTSTTTAHDDLSPYEIVERYGLAGVAASAAITTDYSRSSIEDDKSPPLPVPSRRPKFDAEITPGSAPERPKKQFNISSSEEDYLTPITFPEKDNNTILPPPTQKTTSKTMTAAESKSCDSLVDGLDITLSQLTLSGLNELARKLNIPAGQLSNMTLVQLTNFLSNFIKSNNSSVPVNNHSSIATTISDSKQQHSANSNEFLPSFQADFAANFTNFNNSATGDTSSYDRYAVFRELIQEEIKQTKIDSEPEEILEEKEKLENSVNSNVNLNLKPLQEEPITDKYAALREIVEIELKQSEIAKDEVNQNQSQNDIEDIAEEEEDDEEIQKNNIMNGDTADVKETEINIVNKEIMFQDNNDDQPLPSNVIEYNIIEKDIIKSITPPPKSPLMKSSITITPIPPTTTTKSPVPSGVGGGPITTVVDVTTQQNNLIRPTSGGSVSDIVSGSSPEIDNTASNSDVCKKPNEATEGESWAIFDQATTAPTESSSKDRQMAQSEEGASPWSSDSKEEFGNNSSPPPPPPSSWQMKEVDQWSKRSKREQQDGWWDTSAEPEVNYCPPNRRSTDSYDEEYHECYDERPPPPPHPHPPAHHHRRRRQQHPSNWKATRAGGGGGGGGGHSSSSRDVSPWEEEQPPRKPRPGHGAGGGRQHLPPHHPRMMGSHQQQQYDRRRRVVTDSWDDDEDDDDDYEYEEEEQPLPHPTPPHFHWSSSSDQRHGPSSRDLMMDARHDNITSDRYFDERRHRRRRDPPRDRWCCPDWEQSEYDKSPRYGAPPPARWTTNMDLGSHNKRRGVGTGDFHYGGGGGGGSQESPWEDEYLEAEDTPPPPAHYVKQRTSSGERGGGGGTTAPSLIVGSSSWKQRPSSATDAERKSASMDIGGGKGSRQHYMMGTGGSDGERDRRYKPAKRSRSRDSTSQYSSEPPHRHKVDLGLPPLRNVHRSKPHAKQSMPPADEDYTDVMSKKMEPKESVNKKPSTLSRKKGKDNLSKAAPAEEVIPSGTFPRKSSSRAKCLFENDFIVPPTDGGAGGDVSRRSATAGGGSKFNFEEFETSEAESPTTLARLPLKAVRQQTMFEKGSVMVERDFKEHRGGSLRETKLSPRYQPKSKSLFEDDFSPNEKCETVPDDCISSIKEEIDREEDDEFVATNLENSNDGRRRMMMLSTKSRLSNNSRSTTDVNLKKSESVNIFAREDDPFDDDFFASGGGVGDPSIIGGGQDRQQTPVRNTELRWTEDFDN